jgi:hypothetical protein
MSGTMESMIFMMFIVIVLVITLHFVGKEKGNLSLSALFCSDCQEKASGIDMIDEEKA